MLVVVSLESEGEMEMMDFMLSQQRRYILFCSGTIESIAHICGIVCSRCHENFRQPPVSSENNEELFMMFALKSKEDTLELLCNLTETGLTKVQTSASLLSFLNSRQPVCTACTQQEEQEVISIISSSSQDLLQTPLFKVEEEVAAEPADTDAVSENNSQEKILENSKNVAQRLLNDLAASSQQAGLGETKPNERPLDRIVKCETNSPGVNTPGYGVTIEERKNRRTRGKQQCQACKKRLAVGAYTPSMSWSTLQQHARIHISTFPFTCRLCDYKCRVKRVMDSHFLSHHAGQKAAFIDMSSHPDYIKEVNDITKQCFPDWVPPMLNRGRGRPRSMPIA